MIRKTIIGLCLISIGTACSTNESEKAKEAELTTKTVEEKPTEVKVVPLEYKDFNYELISNGTIAAMNKADLKFQAQEKIIKIDVRNGDKVVKGQKIAELDKFKLESNLRQADEALEKAKLDLQDLLIGQGYSMSDSSKVPVEIMKIAKLRSNYDQSISNLTMAKHNLKEMTLYAPFTGVVANLVSKEHNYPTGETFCTIIDNNHPEVVFNILENEIPLIKKNDKVIVTPFSSNEYTTEGYISEINPVVDKNGMVRVKAIVNNKEGKFFEGMNVKVRVQRLLGKQLVIPKSALVLRANREVVFTLNGGNKAKWNYVSTTHENSDSYAVLDDGTLVAGDTIISEGTINLAHEAPVIVRNKE